MIPGPLVKNSQAARDIYRVIARGIGNKISKPIRVEDEADHWVVYQYREPKRRQSGGTEAITVEHGGGGLELTIKKCDGALAGNYSR